MSIDIKKTAGLVAKDYFSARIFDKVYDGDVSYLTDTYIDDDTTNGEAGKVDDAAARIINRALKAAKKAALEEVKRANSAK